MEEEVGDQIDDGSTMDQTVVGDLGGRVELISLKWLIDESKPVECILLKWLIDESKPCASESFND